MLQRNDLRSHNESERTLPPARRLIRLFQAVKLVDQDAEVANFVLQPAQVSNIVFHLLAEVFMFEARDIHGVARCHPPFAPASLLDAKLSRHDQLLSKSRAEVGFGQNGRVFWVNRAPAPCVFQPVPFPASWSS
jgi:hypothetical protein